MPTPDLDKITEPAPDPTEKRPAKKAPVKKGPKLESVPEAPAVPDDAPKVSPRTDYEVLATVGGRTYGPFSVEAVDESEAIQRTLDTYSDLKAQASASGTRFKARKLDDKKK